MRFVPPHASAHDLNGRTRHLRARLDINLTQYFARHAHLGTGRILQSHVMRGARKMRHLEQPNAAGLRRQQELVGQQARRTGRNPGDVRQLLGLRGAGRQNDG